MEINDWAIAAASNNFTVPDGFPENMQYSGVNNSAREIMAVLSRWQKDTNGSLASTGAADVYAIAANQTITALYTGLSLAFRPNVANTGACTLNVDALGATSIKMPDGSDPPAGALDTDAVVRVVYNGTSWVLVAGAAALAGTSATILGDVTITSTDAGAAVAPIFTLDRNSASPAANDVLGGSNFAGRNSAAETIIYGGTRVLIESPTDGAEEGSHRTYVMIAGVLTEVVRADNTGVVISSTDAGAGSGPILQAYRNSASPAADDLVGGFLIRGKDDGANDTDYGFMFARIDDPTDTVEKSTVVLQRSDAGALTDALELSSDGGLFSERAVYSRSGLTSTLATSASEVLFTGENASVYLVSLLDNANNGDYRALYSVTFGVNGLSSNVSAVSLDNANVTIQGSGAANQIEVTNTGASAAFKWKATRLL